MTYSETLPICKNCTLRDLPADEFTDSEHIQARERVVDLYYNHRVSSSGLRDELMGEGFDEDLAHEAANCLGKIMRRYCRTADIGYVNSVDLDDGSLGLVPR
jgi:hypothetical protein